MEAIMDLFQPFLWEVVIFPPLPGTDKQT